MKGNNYSFERENLCDCLHDYSFIREPNLYKMTKVSERQVFRLSFSTFLNPFKTCFEWKRRRDGARELCPQGEAKDAKSAPTKVKLIRAQGECLGTESRRRTRQAAISCGEEQISIDPQISEWGNPAGQYPVILH